MLKGDEVRSRLLCWALGSGAALQERTQVSPAAAAALACAEVRFHRLCAEAAWVNSMNRQQARNINAMLAVKLASFPC